MSISSEAYDAADIQSAINSARAVRSAYIGQSLTALIKALVSVARVALSALAIKAPLAGHRAHTGL